MRRAVCAAARLGATVRSFATGKEAYASREEVTNRVLNVVKNFPKVNILKLSPTSHFQKDLGLDSLDAVEVVMALEDEFKIEIPDSDSDKIVSCADAIEYIATRPSKKESLIHHF
ncbi:hypothetical protein SELMODRAFT_104768 [Selaginella moellendorffii]|uniref:Acyl carrier protein n=1 Tax=Selaginella moellendorffii TaxID=88036 RepID=D8RZE7_SELML|nr:acyl carrier protein 1, mitochondrial [Selaginella moellendorffii]XP_002994056.1 acyl carrier protein 1, mitochondrial [Selaginella moellendorffii]EFJ04890.1 hypothetical protein SELMODRAFT_187704 [Selaginella moellendorffii]EFJ22598.1 hypothetical protein SELMODRAFT_104768 [Selaginella moellendorffii]|eukprot:XP_002976338.1 acyl carrier protein 1, mitochondrial [Selaginella moellendorffii]